MLFVKSLSLDILFILLFFFISFLYAVIVGKKRVIMIMVSSYFGIVIFQNLYINNFLLKQNLGISKFIFLKFSVFIGFVAILFFLLYRSILRKIFKNSKTISWWQLLLFGVLQIGLIISIVFSGVEINEKLFIIFQKIFISDNAKILWLILPVLTMAIFGKRGKY